MVKTMFVSIEELGSQVWSNFAKLLGTKRKLDGSQTTIMATESHLLEVRKDF